MLYMGEKLYRPVISDRQHLVNSTKTPGRVRGLARDENNKNPDIPEWEEVEIEDRYDNTINESYLDEEYRPQLSPEEEKLAQEIGVAIAVGSLYLIQNVIIPWWIDTAWPWICERQKNVRFTLQRKRRQQKGKKRKKHIVRNATVQLPDVSAPIDIAFDQLYFDMDTDEAQQHMLKIIYHMIELAKEIRIMSNVRIKQESKTKKESIEGQKIAEQYLTTKVSDTINKLLSDERLSLDIGTSKEIFSLVGGGIRINGEYVPVEAEKVRKAICDKNIKIKEKQKLPE